MTTLWALAGLNRTAWWQPRPDEARGSFALLVETSGADLYPNEIALAITALSKVGSIAAAEDRLQALAARGCGADPRALRVFLEAVQQRAIDDPLTAVLWNVVRECAMDVKLALQDPHRRCDPNVRTAMSLLGAIPA